MNDLIASWQSAFAFLDDYPVAMAAAIIVTAVLLAHVVAWLVTQVVGYLAKRTHFQWDDKIVAAIHGPL